MVTERQTNWGWEIATAIFLGGAGGGIFLISFVMDVIGILSPLARIGAVVGPVLVILCATFLLTDLRRKIGFYRLFTNLRTSWMSRGTWFITLFVIFGMAYALPAFWFTWGIATLPGTVIGVIAAVCAFLVIVYTGILFGILRRLPLWNTPALPLLFIVSALSTGMAILLVIGVFSTVGLEKVASVTAAADIFCIIAELIILGLYLEIVRQGGTTGVESVRLLLNPLFLICVVGLGLVIPIGLLVYAQAGGDMPVLPVLSSIVVLIGGWFLRYSILKAGVHLPLYPVLSNRCEEPRECKVV
jgi:formate-dependent nitrite reductase membrane component NrfD